MLYSQVVHLDPKIKISGHKKTSLVYWAVKIAILNSKIDKVICDSKILQQSNLFLKKIEYPRKKLFFEKRKKIF